MAVKHKVVECAERPVDGPVQFDRLQIIIRLVQHLRSEPSNMPEGRQLVKICETIVESLGMLQLPTDPAQISNFMNDLQMVRDFLDCVCHSNKEDITFAILKTLYSCISDSNKPSGAAMCIVLEMVDEQVIPKAISWILGSGQHPDVGQQLALTTLCNWLVYWSVNSNLSEWILAFMHGLESEKRYDILINVTLNCVENLFRLLVLPAHRLGVSNVVIHMLTSMQHSPAAFHKIIPHVQNVIQCLKNEKSNSSIKCLQAIIDICNALMEHFPGYISLYDTLNITLQYYNPSAKYKSYLECNTWVDNQQPLVVARNECGKVGLNNLGNTCYMNSVLQALFMTKMFSNDVLIQKTHVPLIKKLQTLFALLQFSKRASLSPHEILNVARPPGFQQGHQHDSYEFLGYMFDVLHEQEKSLIMLTQEKSLIMLAQDSQTATTSRIIPTHPDTQPVGTIVQKTFGGQAIVTHHCCACGTKSTRTDDFRELQLSFPSEAAEGQSVQTLLDFYLHPERLCGDNQYQCDTCNGLTDADRAIDVVKTPARLVITIKHFGYNPHSQQRTKILQRVKYDPVIVLSAAKYNLYAAVVHCGVSLDSGHYYTYARDSKGWYKFNDSEVLNSFGKELFDLHLYETPYILFYSRADCADPEPVPRSALPPAIEDSIVQDFAELDAEIAAENRKKRFSVSSNNRRDRDDDQPPNCGGGEPSIGFQQNKFVY